MQQQAENRDWDRQTVIMDAMTGLVLQYGYTKVTMDDIAKASGISRPALYQFFKNKQEIYRAIAAQMCRDALDAAESVLSGDGPAEERLVGAVMEGKLRMLAEMEKTHHGSELLDLGNELSADIIAEFTASLTNLFTALFAEVTNGEHFRNPAVQASNLVLWLEGMKQHVRDPHIRESMLRDFVAMQFAAMEAG